MKTQLLFLTIIWTTIVYSQPKLESVRYQPYDEYTGKSGINYEYNANGYLTTKTFLSANPDESELKVIERYLYIYDAENKLSEIITQVLDDSEYKDLYKDVYKYNAEGQIIEIVDKWWNNDNQWEDSSLESFIYTNDKISEVIYKTRSEDQWKSYLREIITYDGNNITQIRDEEWDGTQWTSENSTKTLYEYDNKNQLTSYNVKDWKNNAWQEDYSEVYAYDSEGNRISASTIYEGNIEELIEYSYDLSSQMDDYFHPFTHPTSPYIYPEDAPVIGNKILSETLSIYSATSDKLELYEKISYNYEGQLSTSQIKTNQKISIHPNPSRYNITLIGLQENSNIKIFNTLGKKVVEKSISPNEVIDIKSLPNGLYFVKVNNLKTIKFIKK